MPLASISLDITKGENWERLGKFVVTNVLVSIVVCLVILLILDLTQNTNAILTSVIIVAVILMGQVYALSWYENWRGCELA